MLKAPLMSLCVVSKESVTLWCGGVQKNGGTYVDVWCRLFDVNDVGLLAGCCMIVKS
eukprot:m.13194 g.13194  ORF g.13194 m.13194 type:complete len:57 (-) comp4485_c0_seq1:91-261(-)